MKCWPWEYFRTSVASRAILGRRGMDDRVLDSEVAAVVAAAASGLAATADCVSVRRNSRRVTAALPAFRCKEAMADSVFIETGGDSAQFQEASQRSALKTCRSLLCFESPPITLTSYLIGEYGGNLSNGGERLLMLDGARTVIDLTYGTDPPWPVSADGAGNSLELLDWNGDLNSATNWKASIELGGTPGRVPGAVLRIESVMLENQRVLLRFMARAGVPYTLSYKPDLSASNWIPLDELPSAPAPGIRQFENEVAGATQQRYYRISSP